MKTTTVHCASPIRDEDTSGEILITRALHLDVAGECYPIRDAVKIADVLVGSLPGSTLDLLVAELLKRKASQLRVSYPSLEQKPTLEERVTDIERELETNTELARGDDQ